MMFADDRSIEIFQQFIVDEYQWAFLVPWFHTGILFI